MNFSLIITIVYGASYALVVIITSIYCAWKVRQRINKTKPTDITPSQGLSSSILFYLYTILVHVSIYISYSLILWSKNHINIHCLNICPFLFVFCVCYTFIPYVFCPFCCACNLNCPRYIDDTEKDAVKSETNISDEQKGILLYLRICVLCLYCH